MLGLELKRVPRRLPADYPALELTLLLSPVLDTIHTRRQLSFPSLAAVPRNHARGLFPAFPAPNVSLPALLPCYLPHLFRVVLFR